MKALFRPLVICAAIVLTGVAGPSVVLGAEPVDDSDNAERPWAKDVTPEDRAEGKRLFDEATNLLKDAFFTRSVELYREAITFWDHPAIHFNLSKALMNLDKAAEAYGHLKSAMKYGGDPLDADQIKQVEYYIDYLYKNDLAEVIIETDEPGAKVTLDGTDLFVGPGQWTGVVRPEKTKTLLATKLGFQTQQITPELVKGQMNRIKIDMVGLESVTRYERAFDAWIPWAVIGGGVALIGGGAVMTVQSSNKFQEFDDAVSTCNSDSPFTFEDDTGRTINAGVGQVGVCKPTSSLLGMKDDGELFQTLSIVGYAAGGAVLTTGLILLYINREKPISVEQPIQETAEEPVVLVPVFTPHHVGASLTVGF